MDASSWRRPAPTEARLQSSHIGFTTTKPVTRFTRMLKIATSAALVLALVLIPSANNLALAAPANPVVVANTLYDAPNKLNYFPDSPVILYHDKARNVFRTPDEGKAWNRIKNVPERVAMTVVMHAFDPNIAYIITQDKTQWKTTDQGASWSSFQTEYPPIDDPFVLSFHAKRPGWVLIMLKSCNDRGQCHQEAYYTKDGFETAPKKLLAYTHKCEWAVSSTNFDDAPTELIHCLYYKRLREDGSVAFDDAQLVKSQDYFENQEVVMLSSNDRSAIVNFVTKESFLLVAEKHLTTGDMSLWISDDAKTWAKANFPEPSNLRQDSYTILESTAYSLIVDVKTSPQDSYGSLMLSNSNGTYFNRAKQYTNRGLDDTVDFEKVQNIDGVYIVNVVDNYASSPREYEKRLRTQISFEAGATWQYIEPSGARPDGRSYSCSPNKDGSCSLHLHSVTSAKVAPPVFSSKAAPGVIMGVGNVGPYLLPWEQCDTFLSEDGGLTWKAVLEHPHKYEFGDMGALIVAMRDDNIAVNFFQYTTDRGQSWRKYELGDDSIYPGALISDPESTSQKFLLFTRLEDKYIAYQLDLSNVYERKCVLDENNLDRSDYEKWYARNVGNNPDCLMGVKTSYWRRKANAECMVAEKFKDPRKTEEICACTDEDFECDYNFVLKDGECVLSGREAMPDGSCKDGDTYLGSSGYRKIPGNNCDSDKGLKKDEPKTKTCSAQNIPTDITHAVTKFDSMMQGGFHYFLKSSVVMLLTETKQAWRSVDDGTNWKRVLPDAGRIFGIYIHDEDEKRVYIFTQTDVYVSKNNGDSFDKRALPVPPNKLGFPLVDFHPDSDKHDWMLYLGQHEDECFTRLYRTRNAGSDWALVETWVDKAVYAAHRHLDMPDNGIFAMAWKTPMQNICQDEAVSTETHPLQFIYKLDIDKLRLVLFDHVVQFYVIEKFLAVAVEVDTYFVLHVSLNGHDFAKAVFPPNIRVDKNGFTVLQSTTGSLVVDVAVSNVPHREHGRLFKSNSNGTYFSLQLENTNRNEQQLVDWEKLGGIEGVILANQVINTGTMAKDREKHIRTLVSFNDGSTWNPVRAPTGSDCDDDDCYLHLHSVTDYNGPGAVFSASSSVGLVMGVGNVGKYLKPLESSRTYLSRNAGKTWQEVMNKRTLYEFGDEGGVLVMVDPSAPTQEASFSYDFGGTWKTTVFADAPVLVQTITTEPTSHTSKITITGIYVSGDRQAVVSTLDFGNRPTCVMDKGNPDKSDFEKWSPFEGEEDRCLLGREITYWRRKANRACRVNDDDGVPETEQVNCKCTERDFECDIGFFKNDRGKCERFGHDPEKPATCDSTYMAKSGFRKIQASVCKDGVDLEKVQVERQCGLKQAVVSKASSFGNKYEHSQDTVFYFPKSNVAVLKLETHVYISKNDGKDWTEKTDIDGIVTGVQRNPYDDLNAVIGTSGRTQYLTQDRGLNWDPLELPLPSAATTFSANPWSFHPTKPEWMIFLGEKGCSYEREDHCHIEAFYTQDSGKTWNTLATWVRSCSWARASTFKLVHLEGIYCEEYEDRSGSQKVLVGKNTPVRLVYTDTYMRSSKVLFDTIVGYAIYSDYLIAAEFVPNTQALRVTVSMDGTNFNLAHYPSNFDVENHAYTVLDSSTRSVFMAINIIDRQGSRVANLVTSNSNGTYFSLSRKYVSESDYGNVDFEKMQGIEGVALLNEVLNHNEANQGRQKELRSLITVNNGHTWEPLKAPAADSDGQLYDCHDSDCSLHLHNYLDRKHVEDMFSSPSIPGMVIGVGNVDKSLGEYAEGNTFLTRDGGHSWKEILKGPYQYDFGDQGSIVLMVKDDERPTDHVVYSLDHGKSFQPFVFSNEKVIVKDIVTKPGGIGKSFLLFAVPQSGGSNTAKQLIYQIDFEGLDLPPCRFDANNESDDDFERWSIADLRGEKCMFGRNVEYYRRVEDTQCFVGELAVPKTIQSNCQCTANDFECDYNYEPDDSGNCVLIPDAKPLEVNEKEVCASLPEGQNFYYESIGYRKMAFSSCVGEHQRSGNKKYCPGKGGFGFFGWVGILAASGGGAFAVIFLLNRYKSYFGGRGSFIQLGNDVYDQIHLPRSSSLPSMNMPTMRVPRSFSRSLGRFRMPNVVYKAWDKVSATAAVIVPGRVRGYFGGGGGYRYQNLSQEPGEVIMDDYFDHYLDDDDEENTAGAVGSSGLLSHDDGLQDAQERYRDDSEDEDDDGDEELNNMV